LECGAFEVGVNIKQMAESGSAFDAVTDVEEDHAVDTPPFPTPPELPDLDEAEQDNPDGIENTASNSNGIFLYLKSITLKGSTSIYSHYIVCVKLFNTFKKKVCKGMID